MFWKKLAGKKKNRKLFKLGCGLFNMETQYINPNEYMRKIVQIEAMLNELKQEFLLLDKDFQKSIERGEQDIREGKITICKSEEDLDNFFASI